MIKHIPVLPKEVIKYLDPLQNEHFIDATCGLGGHTLEILKKNGPKGEVLAIDQDTEALKYAQERLKKYYKRVNFAQANFSKLGLLVRSWKVTKISGILFDLGVSTYQLKEANRGFSFNLNAPLDMRMSPQSQRISAYEIVNFWDERRLSQILKELGEEPFAKAIAREIVKVRKHEPIKTTDKLVEVIKRALPPKYRYSQEKHFATSTFRALRMAVNNELESLESALKQVVQVLAPGGRIVIISFHSLEDRIVKNFFRDNPGLEILTPKPVLPQISEITSNPSARSGKLRAARKL